MTPVGSGLTVSQSDDTTGPTPSSPYPIIHTLSHTNPPISYLSMTPVGSGLTVSQSDDTNGPTPTSPYPIIHTLSHTNPPISYLSMTPVGSGLTVSQSDDTNGPTPSSCEDNTVTLGHMLFNINTLVVFNEILSDTHANKQKALEPLIRLIKAVVRYYSSSLPYIR